MSLINENKDFGVIAELIPNNASVIDVGCNDGSLLEYLREYKNIDGRGMEIDQKKVQLCLAKGISVIEGDADTDLYDYPDKLFDYSILMFSSFRLMVILYFLFIYSSIFLSVIKINSVLIYFDYV